LLLLLASFYYFLPGRGACAAACGRLICHEADRFPKCDRNPLRLLYFAGFDLSKEEDNIPADVTKSRVDYILALADYGSATRERTSVPLQVPMSGAAVRNSRAGQQLKSDLMGRRYAPCDEQLHPQAVWWEWWRRVHTTFKQRAAARAAAAADAGAVSELLRHCRL
jgi:hypothetical protein